jgi:hypothetical protein
MVSTTRHMSALNSYPFVREAYHRGYNGATIVLKIGRRTPTRSFVRKAFSGGTEERTPEIRLYVRPIIGGTTERKFSKHRKGRHNSALKRDRLYVRPLQGVQRGASFHFLGRSDEVRCPLRECAHRKTSDARSARCGGAAVWVMGSPSNSLTQLRSLGRHTQVPTIGNSDVF